MKISRMLALFSKVILILATQVTFEGATSTCTKGQKHAAIRLVNGNASSGRLEMCDVKTGEIGTLCYKNSSGMGSSFTTSDIEVACFQLGFAGYLSPQVVKCEDQQFGCGHDMNYLYTYVDCDGSEEYLTDCKLNTKGIHSCDSTGDLKDSFGIFCANEYQVKLESFTSGVVSHYYNGSFGTICSDDWGNENGDVVCWQLGLKRCLNTSLVQKNDECHFKKINFHCNGNESKLTECPHDEIVDSQICEGGFVPMVICEGATPENVTVDEITAMAITFQWNMPIEAVYYNVQIGYSVNFWKEDGGDNETIIILTNEFETAYEFDIRKLAPVTEYFVRVAVQYPNFYMGPYSTAVSFKTIRNIPPGPTEEAPVIALSSSLIIISILFVFTWIFISATLVFRYRTSIKRFVCCSKYVPINNEQISTTKM